MDQQQRSEQATAQAVEVAQDRTRRLHNARIAKMEAEARAAVFTDHPNAEVLLNGRCVGHPENGGAAGTVLVIDWHDPDGCAHIR